MAENVSIADALKKSGVISINPKGQSMFPYIRETDTVIIKRRDGAIKKYDCVLFFEKENVYVLHRYLKSKDGFFLTMGDNNLFMDRPVREEEIVGVLDGFYRNGKYRQVYGKKPPLSVVIGCFSPVKVARIYFYRALGKFKRLLKTIFKK